MIKTSILASIFNSTVHAISKWRKEKRPAVEIFDLYFNDVELQEYLETKKIKKLELIKDMSSSELEKILLSSSFDINMLNLKLIVLPSVAKQVMIDQLKYCIENKIDYTIEIAITHFKSNYEKALEQFIALFENFSNLLKPNPAYSEKDKNKFKFYLYHVFTQEEIKYINLNKEEIIRMLDTFRGINAYSNW